MSPFDEHLQYISQKITISDKQRPIYTRDFDIIRDHVLNILREDEVFRRLFQGPALFGSYSNNVRIKTPEEFDVIMKLSFPFSFHMDVDQDDFRPGYVLLDCENVMEKLYDNHGYQEIYDELYNLCEEDSYYLDRINLKRWIRTILKRGLRISGRKYVIGHLNDVYLLKYSCRGVAHTIYANCGRRQISIDFVPGILIGEIPWVKKCYEPQFYGKYSRWYAIPKPVFDEDPNNTCRLTFMLCNPNAEHFLLFNKQNLKVVYRLLKSIRDSYDLDRFKSYFITTVFLWEIKNREKSFWKKPISELLIYMLKVISDYCEEEDLPFFWDPDLNLFGILTDEEMEEYSEQFKSVYNKLRSYPFQPGLTLGRTLTHFDIE